MEEKSRAGGRCEKWQHEVKAWKSSKGKGKWEEKRVT